MNNHKTAVIIGAGPAGLTAAYELLKHTDITPIIFEQTDFTGGISKTVDYKGNRIDLGGHRFFSKSERVNEWWLNIIPIQGAPSKDDLLLSRSVSLSTEENAPDPEQEDRVMLVRKRFSRIFFLRKFFNYPISLNLNTIKLLGPLRLVKIGLSYLRVCLFPIKEEKTLEDFFINRFGKNLYETFFKDYTEKVWGVPCKQIKPEWGAQRIKSLSITKTILHIIRKIFIPKSGEITDKEQETSLIEQFMYPKFGPGQLWEIVAEGIKKNGGRIEYQHRVTGIQTDGDRVIGVSVRDIRAEKDLTFKADYIISTMPVKELIVAFDGSVPTDVAEVAEGLKYRDFMTAGLLLKKMKIHNDTKMKTVNNIIPDNWLYIQESGVNVGRIQIFNNWSPYMVQDDSLVWLGMEYFCNENDSLWNMPDDDFKHLAIDELTRIGLANSDDVIDGTVIRMPKAYPAYFGTYDDFDTVRKFTDKFTNLFLIGRNGMHRYNNQDHSMMTAIVAVENIVNDITSKDNIWNVNTEQDYHESESKIEGK